LGNRTHEPINLQKLNKECEYSNLQTTPNLLYTLLGAGIFKTQIYGRQNKCKFIWNYFQITC
jgi:hypothetical protein